MRKTSYLRKGACAVAAAALAGCMVPAAALAADQTSTGGTSEVTSSGVEVVYEKDCSWTATYPTSVTLADGTGDDAGTASADIEFNVKGLIDVDHQVTITPTSTSVTLTGERHSGTLAASIAGGTAAAADVNTTAGATVTGSATATIPEDLAVDKYSGTTTFSIQCAEPAAETYVVTVSTNDDTTIGTPTVAKGTTWSLTGGDTSGRGATLTIGDKQYGTTELGDPAFDWVIINSLDPFSYTVLTVGQTGTVTSDMWFMAETVG